jgi:hypothetical protein
MAHNEIFVSNGILLRKGAISLLHCVSLQNPKALMLFALEVGVIALTSLTLLYP